MSNFFTRVLRIVDEDTGIDPIGSTEPGWPVPAELRQELDGVYGENYYLAQRVGHLEKELKEVVAERDQYADTLLRLCALSAMPEAEPDGTPIGDELATELQFAGWI